MADPFDTGPITADGHEHEDRAEVFSPERLGLATLARLIDASLDGIAVVDQNGLFVYVNPAGCEIFGYPLHELIGRSFFSPSVKHAREDGRPQRGSTTVARPDGEEREIEYAEAWVEVDGHAYSVGVIRDVTGARRLEREGEALMKIASRVAFGGSIEAMLDDICHHVVSATGAVAAAIILKDPQSQQHRMVGTFGLPEGYAAAANVVLASGTPLFMQSAFDRREPAVVRDMRRKLLGNPTSAPVYPFMQSAQWDTLVAVPMVYRNQQIGVLNSYHPAAREIGEAETDLQVAIANQVAIAIENASLYDQAQKTARLSRALAQTASRVAFGGTLGATLNDICRDVVSATGAVASAVLLFGPEGAEMREAHVAGASGLPDDYVAAVNKVLAAGARMESIEALLRRKVSIVERLNPRLFEMVDQYPEYEAVLRFVREEPFGAYVSVPMVYGDKLAGGLLAYYPPGREIDDLVLAFQSAIADQTAVAVENARLLAQVKEVAALEQRRHLARELHDSVSQALFSINLTAHGIETVLQRDPDSRESALHRLADLRQLTQGALAEMRALIFELRPGALEEEGLLQALRKHAAAVQARELLEVQVVCAEDDLPRLKPAAEEALYRIAQEALHNVVKHAKASRVEISLELQDGTVALSITDNGAGFDPGSVPAGHMGLGTMGQRSQALGGEYSVQSAPGEGTTVTVRVPLASTQ